VQVILVDYRVQKLLFEEARSEGEDQTWLDSLFHAGPDSLFQHARRHRDHFHVRLFSPRAQELGVRLQRFLAEQKDDNVVIHRVVKGDSLGKLAQRYGSTVALIQKANGLAGTALSIGRTLSVPLRGPCTQCPVPPPVVVPPRRLPPVQAVLAPADAGIQTL
jgi:LysM repeat protein